MYEIEFKYRLPEHDSRSNDVVDKIQSYCSPLIVEETDFHGTVKGEHYLRVRKTECRGVTEYCLIYKGPVLSGPDEPKTRKELEFTIEEGDSKKGIELISTMCDKLLPPVIKRRFYYKMGEIVVSLDQVENLGLFVEVEVLEESEAPDLHKLYSLVEALGLDPAWRISKGYGDLLEDKIKGSVES